LEERGEMGGTEWRECRIRPRVEVLVYNCMHAWSWSSALLAIRRTVRRPRLTVPTNLQAVIVVDMVVCIAVEPWRQCLVRKLDAADGIVIVGVCNGFRDSTSTAMKLWQCQ
jgi:hypothetical protein